MCHDTDKLIIIFKLSQYKPNRLIRTRR